MKLHISGPMTGFLHDNRPAFNHIAGVLLDMGHVTYNPATDVDINGKTYREMLAQNLAWICEEAQGMVLLPGFERSRGSTAERSAAQAICLPIWRAERLDDGVSFVPLNAAARKLGQLTAPAA